MNPLDYDVPPEYRRFDGDPAEDHIGPFFCRFTENGAATAFRALPHHCNSHGSIHGGVLMAFIDYTLCVAAAGDTGDKVVTVSLNNEFIAGAPAGVLVLGHGEVTRRGGSLIFTRGHIEVDGKTILTASAVVKRLRR